MAAIRKRNGKWHVQIRIKGHASQTKSFVSKRDAERWARITEAELEASTVRIDTRVLDVTTVGDLLEKYRTEVTVRKRGYASENKRIDGFIRQPWAGKYLSQFTPQIFSRYRDDRLKLVRPGTVIHDLGLLRSVFEVARQEWDYPLSENPLAKVRKPKAPEARDRRLGEGELDCLLEACAHNRNEWLKTGIQLAVETGMRRGEMLSLLWADVCFETRTLVLRRTKNGQSRRIPLTERASGLLKDRSHHADTNDKLVFPISANAFRQCWERNRRKAALSCPSVTDLRFHDLRHEAVSRFFELGLSVPEVALISGHRDPRMLFRYTHLRAEDLVEKLNARTCRQHGGIVN